VLINSYLPLKLTHFFCAQSFPGDVSDRKSMFAMAEAVDEHFGSSTHIALLAANAGVGGARNKETILGSDEQDWGLMYGVNTLGAVWTFQAFSPRMINQQTPCAIVTTASAMSVLPGQGLYGVSKHAVLAATEALFFELRQKGAHHVHVHALLPGVVSTNIQQNANKLLERELSPRGKESVALFEKEQQELGMSAAYIAKQTFK
jgi:NAD(P)-dependent dehydrogenase (short-subunit alcohol dehydrogenase family)